MDYSADLPINTMGRRVRTRLYFTSESHLHTLVNVLRFAYDEENSKNSPLSKFGRAVIANAPELCYLTQIVFRLFEDRNKDLTDPKRYRVEILFSPGAASPPRHTSDVDPENDSSRFDTEEVEVISKESLTCKELEDYLDESIKAGFIVEEDMSISSSAHGIKKDKNSKKRKGTTEIIPEVFEKNSSSSSGSKSQQVNAVSTGVTPSNDIKQPSDSDASAPELSSQQTIEGDLTTNVSVVGPAEIEAASSSHLDTKGLMIPRELPDCSIDVTTEDKPERDEQDPPDNEVFEDERIKELAKLIAKRYLWRGIALGSLILGFGLIVFARQLQNDMRTQRKWRRL